MSTYRHLNFRKVSQPVLVTTHLLITKPFNKIGKIILISNLAFRKPPIFSLAKISLGHEIRQPNIRALLPHRNRFSQSAFSSCGFRTFCFFLLFSILCLLKDYFQKDLDVRDPRDCQKKSELRVQQRLAGVSI